MGKKRKVRVDLRKNRQNRTRENDLTSRFQRDEGAWDEAHSAERVRAKGELSRRRTILTDAETVGGEADSSEPALPSVDTTACVAGRVIRIHGLESIVETEDGTRYRCGVRRLLKTLAIDERSVLAVGDLVWFRRAGADQGLIERIEPRRGTVTRSYRRTRHVLASNVDQVLIVSAFKQPGLKLALIDRYLISCELGGVRPVVVLNKADLIDLADYQWVSGLYSQIGYEVLITSASDGRGLERLKEMLSSGCTALSGQSGVGKSSLLNAIQPGLKLKVADVSDWTWKGKHTTTAAELMRLETGGYVVDTPGLRQFELWGIHPREIEGYLPEFRPYLPHCRFPDCSHTHEHDCAVKHAVHVNQIHLSRYESYLKLYYQKPVAEE